MDSTHKQTQMPNDSDAIKCVIFFLLSFLEIGRTIRKILPTPIKRNKIKQSQTKIKQKLVDDSNRIDHFAEQYCHIILTE